MSEPTEPAEIHNGLALYQRGQGHPLLALPYPHASGGGPMIDGPLVSLAVGCGFRVSTFDPPGQYRSTRPARVSFDEMLDCATETLGTLRLPARVAVIGHSMSALCAFYLGLAHPDRVAKLVLVGMPPGSGLAIVRYRAMPFHWPPWNPNLWRMAGWGILLASGHGSLETHKKMDLLSERSNFVNQALVSPIVIEPGDRHRPAPPGDRWWHAIRKTRVISRASELRCPTLLIVGRHDPQTPVKISKAIHKRVPDSAGNLRAKRALTLPGRTRAIHPGPQRLPAVGGRAPRTAGGRPACRQAQIAVSIAATRPGRAASAGYDARAGTSGEHAEPLMRHAKTQPAQAGHVADSRRYLG